MLKQSFYSLKAKEFIYFIDLDEPLVCFNLINTNQLTSPLIAHYHTFKNEEYPLYNANPDSLLTDLDSTKLGFVGPRFQYVALSNWARNGLKIGLGITNTKLYSDTDIEKIHRIAELEIEFEKIRRLIDSNLPSRFTCLFLAEDNIDGRTMLKNMFSNRKNFRIAPVEVDFIKVHKADSKWIDAYERNKNIHLIKSYWKGENYDANPQYEYLVDGIVKLKKAEDQKYIVENFDTRPYYHKS
ncbi:DUF2441 domain-containing protein [Maribacter sp. MJ134]|jgi:hypothetical protein|uniref:DUF2441 domain-containing protein n=1 Tax=unclassified Maribacter TaxID=2615042 RepID=UPI000F82DC91|nr:DUF2441 domain-containing protein [Maribacter sp. MJ134]AZQ59837.1 DUF2441 domain-containing protein [Maribacter sp. MJ134]